MKLIRIAILIVVLLSVLFLAAVAVGKGLPQRLLNPSHNLKPSSLTTEIQACPDKWYKNEQPCVYKDSPAECQGQRSEYFIISGERKELDEVDVEWIKKNCEVNKPEVVY